MQVPFISASSFVHFALDVFYYNYKKGNIMSDHEELLNMLILFYTSNVELQKIRAAMSSCKTKHEQDALLEQFQNAEEDKGIAVRYLDNNKHLLNNFREVG